MSSFLVGNIPEDCHPKVQALVAYWRSIHPAEGLPGRQHFEPCDIPTLLASLYLLDVCPQSGALTFRLMGTGLVDLLSRIIPVSRSKTPMTAANGRTPTGTSRK